MEMGSRRTMTRSPSGNGRFLNGAEVPGGGRAPGCSYLSNVRPETRSTLCSVIAQLTEETQPFFEVTLKSKAVSETVNVKFSCVVTGHPTPQLTWYKDDIQLDRFCGLPKYEIFRNGQNHSLHIYNCTVEDAAIYQASAINTKGIVSCSGILEVGEMNEFQIHQRYFSKLKQKAENKRREAEGKENQEPARTISPDRAQRKRRSTVGGYISAPCSTEEDSSERRPQEEATAEARVQENHVEEVQNTNGTMEPVESMESMESMEPQSNTAPEAKDSPPAAHKNDPAQKVFTALQPKTFFKKFKILNPKTGPEEKKSNVESLPQKTEDPMEVESSTSTNSVLPPFKSLKRRVTGLSGKQGLNLEKADRKTTTGNVKAQSGSVSSNSSPVIPPRASKQQPLQPKIKEELNTTPKAADRDKKAKGSPPDTPARSDTPCDGGPALPQPPCQQDKQATPPKETRPAQNQGSVPEPGLKREAARAHAKAQRNEASVDLELQAKLQSTVAPAKTPAERTGRDRRGLSVPSELHKALDKTKRNTKDYSRRSSDICESPEAQKAPVKRPSAGEDKPKCDISPTAQQSQLKTPIKTVEGTEIQLDEKVKCNETSTLIAAQSSGDAKEITQDKTGDVCITNGDTKMDLSNTEKESKSSETVAMSLGGGESAPVSNNEEMLSVPESKDSQKCPSPIPNILSIAELLRSQIIALEESVSSRTAPKHSTENQTGRTESDSNSAEKTNTNTCHDKGPPQTIKETLMQIYNELLKTKDLFGVEAQSPTSPETPKICLPETTLPETTLPLKVNESQVNSQEAPKQDSVQNQDIGEQSKLPPEIKINSDLVKDREIITETLICNGKSQEPEANTSCSLEPVQVLPLQRVVDSESHSQKESPANQSVMDNESHSQKESPANQSVMDNESHSQKESPVNQIGMDNESCSQKESPANQSVLDNESSSQKESPAIQSVTADVLPNVTIETLETSPSLKKKDCVPIPSATPQELASGARRKITKTKVDEPEPSTPNSDVNAAAVTVSTSPRVSRHSALLPSSAEQASPKKKHSPLISRKKSPVEKPSQAQEVSEVKPEENPADKAKNDPFKAPQVIRKIRGETFSDHSGNMKLWCQFFNVLAESTITWHRDELGIAKTLKGAGDETQVNLALAQATALDTGVYGCTITNEYGTDATDFLLSAEVLAGLSLREDLGVGEEIELTPLLFNKGVSGCVWGNKLFGRIMVQESRLGAGFSHKTWRAKVIYGLEPVFESGNTCILKVCNPIVYGGKGESLLIEKNQEVVRQACKIQNLAREYCKIFTAEAKATESFGLSLEVIPVYLLYRPANSIPYATVEADLTGVYSRHCGLDPAGRLELKSSSEVEQKCCALQHWIFQWTSGNMLFTKLEGVESKITNVGISVKSPGHQGLSLEGSPKVFEQFVVQHQCNYFCGLLGLRSLKVMESLLMPTKPKGSKSPLGQRKMGSASSSPQTGRKATASPRTPRKTEQEC